MATIGYFISVQLQVFRWDCGSQMKVGDLYISVSRARDGEKAWEEMFSLIMGKYGLLDACTEKLLELAKCSNP